jgi:transcriptional regulator with XRE-family HTH domain
MTLPNQLRAARKAAKLTQAALADKAGVSLRTLHRLERGDNVSIRHVAVVARALGGRLVWRMGK